MKRNLLFFSLSFCGKYDDLRERITQEQSHLDQVVSTIISAFKINQTPENLKIFVQENSDVFYPITKAKSKAFCTKCWIQGFHFFEKQIEKTKQEIDTLEQKNLGEDNKEKLDLITMLKGLEKNYSLFEKHINDYVEKNLDDVNKIIKDDVNKIKKRIKEFDPKNYKNQYMTLDNQNHEEERKIVSFVFRISGIFS